jgi:hypothetical protein
MPTRLTLKSASTPTSSIKQMKDVEMLKIETSPGKF